MNTSSDSTARADAAAELAPEARIEDLGRRARRAAAALAELTPAAKNRALLAMAEALTARGGEIFAANRLDLEAGRAAGLSAAMLDRLELNPKRLAAMAEALRQIAALEDPVGEIFDLHVRPNGLQVGRMRVPLGVIAILYEARPNVTADAGALCVKSGNAVILRGGKEALRSNLAIAAVLGEAGRAAGLPEGAIQVVATPDRAVVGALLRASQWIDLVIPRGGRSLIERVVAESRIPVIKHYDGNCAVYVDASADPDEAVRILLNAKCQRPGVCNAAETLLVHREAAAQFLPRAIEALAAKGVELRGCEKTRAFAPDRVRPATEDDWRAEYLALILAVKVVDSLDEAIEFINTYGSHHTDAIVTRCHASAMRFLRAVDSACVHINCSTRFSDGGEYGLGAEIGITTDKLHARGQMGLRELTTAKFIVFGQGQIRE